MCSTLTSLRGFWAVKAFPPRCAPPAGPPSWLTPGLCSLRATGQVRGTVWCCIAYELKMIFTFFIGWTKQPKKDTLWHVKIIQNSDFSVHDNFIEAQPLRFAHVLSVACAVMAELSGGDRCGLQSQQCFLGGPWQKNLGSTCLYEDSLPGFPLACCLLSSSHPRQLGVNAMSSGKPSWLQQTPGPGPHFLVILAPPPPTWCFPIPTLATLNTGGIPALKCILLRRS